MQDGNVSPVGKFFRNKWVWLIGAIDIIIVLVIVIAVVINARKTNVINFNVVPSDAQISVNGDTSYTNGQYRFSPGEYTVEISHPGLTSKTLLVDLEHQDAVSIVTFLSDNGNFDYYKLRDHFGDYTALSQIASAGSNQTTDRDTSAETFITNFENAYNLYSTELPVTYSEYTERDGRRQLSKYITIRADYSCEQTLCLKAVLFEDSDRTRVIPMLEDAGFNVEDYEIKYEIR